MSNINLTDKKIVAFIVFLLLPILLNHLYYQLISQFIGVWLIIAVEAAWVAFVLLLVHKWFRQISFKIIEIIEQNSKNPNFSKEVRHIISKDASHGDLIRTIINYQNVQQNEQQLLMDKLTYTNTLLERNSKITDTIMQITSEILASGEIDHVLQTVLEKAIEIIPNATKGSILLYNGTNLEFRAVHGYNPEAFRNVTLEVEEIFQHSLTDFFEPCIIKDAEGYNRIHMTQEKSEYLRENEVYEIESILSCAILVDNEFLGVINLDSAKGSDLFTKEDMPLIKHLATQIGIALKNAWLIEKILYLSKHDSLTGICNRCSFEDYLMKVYQQSKTSGEIFSLVLLDLNDLKKVNDTYGHEAGDLMLKNFARGIKDSLEDEEMFARYGGDEFAIIFPGISKEKAEARLKAVMSVFEDNPLSYCGKRITNISFSYGITEFPSDTAEFEELIRLSDLRMYKNKEESKRPVF